MKRYCNAIYLDKLIDNKVKHLNEYIRSEIRNAEIEIYASYDNDTDRKIATKRFMKALNEEIKDAIFFQLEDFGINKDDKND